MYIHLRPLRYTPRRQKTPRHHRHGVDAQTRPPTSVYSGCTYTPMYTIYSSPPVRISHTPISVVSRDCLQVYLYLHTRVPREALSSMSSLRCLYTSSSAILFALPSPFIQVSLFTHHLRITTLRSIVYSPEDALIVYCPFFQDAVEQTQTGCTYTPTKTGAQHFSDKEEILEDMSLTPKRTALYDEELHV